MRVFLCRLSIPQLMQPTSWPALPLCVAFQMATRLYDCMCGSQRRIDVLVEIDTPGHTAAIANAHPDHVTCNRARPWAYLGK